MPASGTRSFSRAAVIRLWARLRPSHNLVVSAALLPLAIDDRNPIHSGLRSRGLRRLDDDLRVDRQLDLVARERHRPRDAVPVEAEVDAVELTRGADAEALLAAERVGEPALDRASELDGPRRVLDRQVAAEPVVVFVDLLDCGDLERYVGVLLGVEEVGRAKVGVALVVASAEAGDVDLQRAARLGQVAVGAFELAFPAVELAVDGGDGQVFRREADAGVGGIELVLDHVVLLEVGLLHVNYLRAHATIPEEREGEREGRGEALGR